MFAACNQPGKLIKQGLLRVVPLVGSYIVILHARRALSRNRENEMGPIVDTGRSRRPNNDKPHLSLYIVCLCVISSNPKPI